MLTRNKQGRENDSETRMAKVRKGRLKAAERSEAWQPQGTSRVLLQPVISVTVSSEEAHIRVSGPGLQQQNRTVPVIFNGKPLMPTKASRARRWIKAGRATPFWSKGIFCVRLNVRPSASNVQSIAVGIDPGSKREGYTVKSEAHTFLNIQAEAVTWVNKAVEVRRNMRKARRFRKTPCRANRKNHSRGCLPPSTRARWGWKLRIANWLAKLYPISMFVVEDIKARTKGQRRWDTSFSPLEVGKAWFYDELGKVAEVSTKQGWETKQLRDVHGLKKSSKKMAEVFSSHCVDSWVLANNWVGGHIIPDNKNLICIAPIRLHRRQLHAFQPAKGGFRRDYGGTRSLGLKRGSLVNHPKHGLVYVGGMMSDRISLHSVEDGKRLCQNALPSDCKFLTFNTWKRKDGVSSVA